MSDRTRSLVREAASAVPERAGDLQMVRRRAAQRTRRQHVGMALALIAVLAGATYGVGEFLERPTVPVIGTDTDRPGLLVDLCGDSDCPSGITTDPDRALETARSIPGVQDATLVDADDVAASLREAGYPDTITAADVGPNLLVTLEPGANLHEVAVEMRTAIDNAGVRVGSAIGPASPAVPPLNGFDPDVRTGSVVSLASTPLGDLVRWPVADGGICFAVADRPACTAERLYRGADALAYAVTDGWSCTWGIVDDRTTSVEISHLDGTTATAELGAPGDRLLGGFAACVEGITGPSHLVALHPGGESGHQADTGHTIAEEVRSPGTPSRRAIGLAIQEQLNIRELADILTNRSEADAAAALREQLRDVRNPSGVSSIDVADVQTDGSGDYPVRAHLTIRTIRDHPFCLGIAVGESVWADTQLGPGPCVAE